MTYNPKRDWLSIIHACLKDSRQCGPRGPRGSGVQHASQKIHINLVGLGNDPRLRVCSMISADYYFQYASHHLDNGIGSNNSLPFC